MILVTSITLSLLRHGPRHETYLNNNVLQERGYKRLVLSNQDCVGYGSSDKSGCSPTLHPHTTVRWISGWREPEYALGLT